MRKFLVSVALATATIATAVPAVATAQPGYGWQRGGPTRPQVANLLRDLNTAEQRIDRNRGISRREAATLHRQANQIRGQLNRALRGGINAREFASLRSQVNRLEVRVRLEARDHDNRRR